MLEMTVGACAIGLESSGFLLFVLVLLGAQSTFFGPLKYGILPQHLESAELTGGNGLIQLGTYAAILLGGITGGILASLSDLGAVPVVSCIVGLALIGWLASRAIPPAPASDPALVTNWNLAQGTFRLMAYAAQSRETLILVLTISWFWFLGATFLSMVPSYGKDLLGADEQAVTLLNIAFTLGIGVGSVMCERLSRNRIELGLVPLAGIGITLFSADLYWAGVPPMPTNVLTVVTLLSSGPALRAFFDLTLIGACGALFIVPLYAALQARVDHARCARVIAALNVTNALLMVCSALFTLALFQVGFSIPAVFGTVAVLNACAIVGAVVALPEFRHRARTICCDAIARR
jgi:hypothetical protein